MGFIADSSKDYWIILLILFLQSGSFCTGPYHVPQDSTSQ